MADDPTDVVTEVTGPAIYLWAHNSKITYDYTGTVHQDETKPYCDIHPGSVIVDPWRTLSLDMPGIKVVHYGNTRTTK